MTRVPPMVQGIARTAIYRLAVEKGHSVITSDLLDEAMDRYMPKASANATARLAEALVLEHAEDRTISICKKCGVAASEPEPVKCTVCGSQSFQVIAPEVVEEIIKMEGGARRRDDLRRPQAEVDPGSQERPVDHDRRLPASPHQGPGGEVGPHAPDVHGDPRVRQGDRRGRDRQAPGAARGRRQRHVRGRGPHRDRGRRQRRRGKRLIARDAKNNPLFSSFDWKEDAVERVLRVPAGFMRNRVQDRIEELANERAVATIDLVVVEEGLEIGRQAMAQMISGYEANPEAARKSMKDGRKRKWRRGHDRPGRHPRDRRTAQRSRLHVRDAVPTRKILGPITGDSTLISGFSGSRRRSSCPGTGSAAPTTSRCWPRRMTAATRSTSTARRA